VKYKAVKESFMDGQKTSEIGFFQKYLTVWVILCMIAGVLVGKFLPGIPTFLNQFEYAKVSVPTAILIWVMIYPMMMKVDFQSIKNVGRNPKGLFVTWVANWLIKPFSMFAIASFFLYTVFSNFIAPDLAKNYLAGAILLGVAPCTAIALFGTTSPAALATTVGVLTEVPVMLILVKIANSTKQWFPQTVSNNNSREMSL
jgi:ACR3 family arsenite transporter